jgi:hypothetical protein
MSDLGDLAGRAVAFNRYPVGVIGPRWCLAAPFGSSVGGHGPPGVLCAIWPDEASTEIGENELSFVRFVGTHLTRALAERARSDAVSTVASELARIGGGPAAFDETSEITLSGCAPQLANWSDVALAARRFDTCLGRWLTLGLPR